MCVDESAEKLGEPSAGQDEVQQILQCGMASIMKALSPFLKQSVGGPSPASSASHRLPQNPQGSMRAGRCWQVRRQSHGVSKAAQHCEAL